MQPAGHGPGRSRSRVNSKIHLAVEQGQKPMAVVSPACFPHVQQTRHVERMHNGTAVVQEQRLRAVEPGPEALGVRRLRPPHRTPYSAAVPVHNEAAPRRSTAGACWCGSAIRTSRAGLPSGSSARPSIAGAGARNGCRAAGTTKEPTRKTPRQVGCIIEALRRMHRRDRLSTT
jgi:hypothetical protein